MLWINVSDVGQGYTGPKTGDQGQGTKPWTHKKIVLHGQGFKPWTHKNRSRARPGVWTLDRLKRSFVWSWNFTCARNTCRCTNKFRVERVRWMMDDGQIDQKTDDGQNILQMMNDPKRYVPCRTCLFWGTTSCTNSCTFLQAESACNNTYVEYIPENAHHVHLHDKCMLNVFCHQIIFIDN